MSSQQAMTGYMLQHKLAERYVRIDSAQSVAQKQDLGLDIATPAAQSTLKGLACAALRAAISSPELQFMLSHTAPAPQFFYGQYRS